MGRCLIKMDKIAQQIKAVLKTALAEKKQTAFFIGNTAKIIDSEFYLTPIRNYNQFVVTGVIVYSEKIAKRIAQYIDGKVDYVFVDAEKKIEDKNSLLGDSGNIERAVKEEIVKSILISYKANDLTVDAADSFISEYYTNDITGVGGKKVVIMGVGNLGSKLALKLVERGSNVYLYRRSKKVLKLIVDSINSIKPKYTDAEAHLIDVPSEECKDADVIIGMTDGVAVIDEHMISKCSTKPLLIDVGKGSISKKAIDIARSKNIQIYRLSVESVLEGMIASLISTHNILKYRTGRAVIHGINVTSGGLLADKGEVVVDNYSDPKYIYGIGNGTGDFEVNHSKTVKNNIRTLREIIKLGYYE